MLRLLRDSDGRHPPSVRVLAVLVILGLAGGVLITAAALLAPVLHWMLPALF